MSKTPLTDAWHASYVDCDPSFKAGLDEGRIHGNIIERELTKAQDLLKQPVGTEAAVCRDIAGRQQVGIRKYGTTVADNPLTLLQWLQHAYEETLDTAVYLKRAMEELERQGKS